MAADKKKRGESVVQKMKARATASVMDSSGTGDAGMDRLLKSEANRRAAFSGSMGTTSKAVSKGEGAISRALKKMFGRK